MNKFITGAIIAIAGLSAHAQTWTRVALQSPSAYAALPAGATYRWGAGTTWCDQVTISADTTFRPLMTSTIGCRIKGVPAPGPVGILELDVLQIATPQLVTVNGEAAVVTVPAIATVVVIPPPPPPPIDTTGCLAGTATTWTPNYTVTFNATGKITGYTLGISCK